MEKLGIDPALRAVQLHAYLTDPEQSPLPNTASLTTEDERRVLLELREEGSPRSRPSLPLRDRAVFLDI